MGRVPGPFVLPCPLPRSLLRIFFGSRMNQLNKDTVWMRRALELASRCGPEVEPNPRVGALLVRDGRLIGEGWHRALGSAHAEIEALSSCTEDPRGSTLYVSLEPCHRSGLTPPCTDAILKVGISRVVYALDDPNPAESGRSAHLLQEAGLEVQSGILEEEAREQNRIYLRNQESGRPWVCLKTAGSLDGKLDAGPKENRIVSGEESRRSVHVLRSSLSAVVIGAETAFQDRPRLDLRLLENQKGALPRPVVFDSHRLRCPADLTFDDRSPILLIPDSLEDSRLMEHRDRGWKILRVKEDGEGRLHLPSALELLLQAGLASLLVEGGGRLHSALLQEGLWDCWRHYLAARLFPAVGTPLWSGASRFENFRINKTERSGEDLLLEFLPGKEA